MVDGFRGKSTSQGRASGIPTQVRHLVNPALRPYRGSPQGRVVKLKGPKRFGGRVLHTPEGRCRHSGRRRHEANRNTVVDGSVRAMSQSSWGTGRRSNAPLPRIDAVAGDGTRRYSSDGGPVVRQADAATDPPGASRDMTSPARDMPLALQRVDSDSAEVWRVIDGLLAVATDRLL